jgi:hypothetical protein
MSPWLKHVAPSLVAAMLVCFAVSGANAEPRTPRKFDEFSNLACSDELIRLDNYGKELRTVSTALAVVIVYGARSGTRRGEVVARLFAIRNVLVHRNDIDTKRIILLDGGFRRSFAIELWIIPPIPPDGLESVKYLITSDDSLGNVRLRGPSLTTWHYNCDRNLR